jgi:hypothetical protein
MSYGMQLSFCLLLTAFSFGLFFGPEEGGSSFTRNVCELDITGTLGKTELFVVTNVRMLNPIYIPVLPQLS